MGLLRYTKELQQNGKHNTDNNVSLRFKEDKLRKMLPDAGSFPLYCKACNRTQSELFIHFGSRYGQVGSCNCEFCGAVIYVNDHDNIVDSIMTAGTEIFFEELYLLDAKYINELEKITGAQISKALYDYWNEGERKYQMKLNVVCDIIEELTGIKSDSTDICFITDDKYSILPEDINRWIRILYLAGVSLPMNCKPVN